MLRHAGIEIQIHYDENVINILSFVDGKGQIEASIIFQPNDPDLEAIRNEQIPSRLLRLLSEAMEKRRHDV